MKIRYIEASPIKQVREFENREEYNIFIQQRIKEIMDYTYPNNINFYEYFIYKSVGLNKDGNPRKQIDPTKWLRSEKAKKKQKKNFAIYCEKRKKQTKEASFRRKLSEIDSKLEYWQKEKDLLIENHKKEMEN